MGVLYNRCFWDGKCYLISNNNADANLRTSQGMDLADIEVVVQWKATCDLCTLWQRFGRAARGEVWTGTAILLVEKKDTDAERQAKALRAELRLKKKRDGIGTKRKATGQPSMRGAKRPVLGDQPGNMAHHPEPAADNDSDTSDSDDSDEEYDTAPPMETNNDPGAIPPVEQGPNSQAGPSITSADCPTEPPPPAGPKAIAQRRTNDECRAQYTKRVCKAGGPVASGGAGAGGKSKRSPIEIGSGLDDYVNAKAYGFQCRRMIPTLYFGNDERRKSLSNIKPTDKLANVLTHLSH